MTSKIDFCVTTLRDRLTKAPEFFLEGIKFISETSVNEIQTNFKFSDDSGLNIGITVYEKLDGSKSIHALSSPSPKTNEFLEAIKAKTDYVQIKTAHRTIKRILPSQLERIKEVVKVYPVTVSEDSSQKVIFRIDEVKKGRVTLTYFKTNQTLLLQGASNFFFSEITTLVMDLCRKDLQETIEILAEDVTNFSSFHWTEPELAGKLRTRLGSAFDQLWDHDQKRLKTVEVFLDNDINLPEYSIWVCEVAFALEGAIKVFLIKHNIFSEEEVNSHKFQLVSHEDEREKTPFVIDKYRSISLNFDGSRIDQHKQVILDSYEFLRTYRNKYSHSKKYIQLIAKRADAVETIEEALDLIKGLLA